MHYTPCLQLWKHGRTLLGSSKWKMASVRRLDVPTKPHLECSWPDNMQLQQSWKVDTAQRDPPQAGSTLKDTVGAERINQYPIQRRNWTRWKPTHQSKVYGPGTDMPLQCVLHQELVNRGCSHVKSQHSEQVLLHPKHLFLGVGVIRDVHKLIHFRRIHLLVFPNQKDQAVTSVGNKFKEN